MAPIPGFCSGSYTLQSEYVDSERTINFYNEKPESIAAKSQNTLLHTPGLKLAYSLLGENSVPFLFEVNGRGFAAGTYLWELFADGTSIQRGTLNGPPLSPTQIAVNQTHLLILSNGDLFVFVLTPVTDDNGVLHPANEFLPVNMAQFNGPVFQIDFIDGYFIATLQNSNTFQVSDLEDGTTWNGLFISTIGYFPDNITSFKVDHREIQFMSGKKSVWYYNCGAGFPPFIPIQGAYMEQGAGATSATVQANNTVAWIEADERGGGMAMIAAGYVGQRISTYAVEFAWQSYPTIADAVGYAYQDQGHIFWVILFPTANKTWVYDFATSLWHERAFWKNGLYYAHRSMSHMSLFGKHFVGDPKSGSIYEMSIAFYDDFGNLIRRNRRCPDTTKENKWVEFPRVEFDVEVGLQASIGQAEILQITAVEVVHNPLASFGVINITIKGNPPLPFEKFQLFAIAGLKVATYANGQTVSISAFVAVPGGWVISGQTSLLAHAIVSDTGTATLTNGPQVTVPVVLKDGNGQPRAPQLMLSWSNDAAKTFGNEYLLNCGKVGDYDARVYKVMTGRGRRRVWDVSMTDPIPWRIAGAFREAQCEGQAV